MFRAGQRTTLRNFQKLEFSLELVESVLLTLSTIFILSLQSLRTITLSSIPQDILSLMINREINKLERTLAECEDQCKAKQVEMRSMQGTSLLNLT